MNTLTAEPLASLGDGAFKLKLSIGNDAERNWTALTAANEQYLALDAGKREYERRLLFYAFLVYRRLNKSGALGQFVKDKLEAAKISCNSGTASTTKFFRCLYGLKPNADRRATADGTVIAKALDRFKNHDDVGDEEFLSWINENKGVDAIRNHRSGGGAQTFDQRCQSLQADLAKVGDLDTINLEVPKAKQHELIILFCVKNTNNTLSVRRVCRPLQADLEKKRFDLLPAEAVHKNGTLVVPETTDAAESSTKKKADVAPKDPKSTPIKKAA